LLLLFVGAHWIVQPQSEARSPVGVDHPMAVAVDGAEIYSSRCQTCHQKNGQGVPGVFPPVDGTEWVTGDKGRLIRIILNGMTGEVEVSGTTYTGSMPPWGSFLDDEQVAQVATYVRQGWSNDADKVTAEEVAAVREASEDRKQPWTAAELQEFEGIPGQDDDSE
jgi:mono/diheme cytochrome c family protein